ncbi:transposase [Corynebacterium macginleyi]|nr:transposase [Corynebacterium macginleyi]
MILRESDSWKRKSLSCAKNAISCVRPRSILLKATHREFCFQCVYDHRTEYSVKRMCHVLKLNRSSFYKWVSTRKKRRLKMYSDGLIGARIKTIFDDEHGLYGAKRIAASLNSDTDFGPINHKKVARIMKTMGLQGFSKRRRCITTRRKPGHRVMPDLVGRVASSSVV